MDFGDNFTGIFIVCGICVILPIMIVWLVIRTKWNETNKRAEVLLAAIEKNADIDTESITKMMTASSKKKSLKRVLLNRLLTGFALTFIGLPVLVITAIEPFVSDNDFESLPFILSLMCLGIGIAFLINYFVGKRFLAKEIEREENNLPEEE